MRIQADQGYGLRCLRVLARGAPGAVVTARELAQQEAISLAHAAKVLRRLRQVGLLESTRGQQGGYRLAREPGTVRVHQVIAALGERLDDCCRSGRFRGLASGCPHAGECSMRPLFAAAGRLVLEFLAQFTLADLCGPESDLARRAGRCVLADGRAMKEPAHDR